jgi:hypothetical protein
MWTAMKSAGGDRNLDLALDPLDDPDELGDVRLLLLGLAFRRIGNGLDPLRLFGIGLFVADQNGFAAIDGFVADHDRVDVAALLRQVDDRAQLPLVALGIVVEPRAGRDSKAELVGDARHQFTAAGRRIGAQRVGVGRDDLQVGADLRRRRPVTGIRTGRAVIRRKRNAGERTLNVGGRRLIVKKGPKARVHAHDERDDTCYEAHGTTEWGWKTETRTRPLGSTEASPTKRLSGVATVHIVI